MTKHLFTLMIVLALAATACGGDGGGSNTAAPTDPRGQELIALISEDEDFPMTEAEANCTANNMLENLDDSTIDAMLADPEGDIDTLDDPAEAIAAVDSLLDCIDLEEMMVEQMLADGMTTDQAQCMADGFGEDELRSFIQAGALPEDQVDEEMALELIGTMMALAGECGLS